MTGTGTTGTTGTPAPGTPAPAADTPLLEVRDLAVSYAGTRGPVHAVRGVDLEVHPGEITAIVGESGSGKSTTAAAVMGLLPDSATLDTGSVRIAGREVTGLKERQWRKFRGTTVGLVPQDPQNSLSPVQTIGASVAEGLAIHRRGTRATRKKKALELLERVGIDDPARRFDQYPHELSGGMKQRALIAAAVALEPRLLVADEPTSALDVTVQKTILDLLDEMRRELGLGVLLITHDLAVAGDRADRVVVMQHGEVRESGLAATVLTDPRDGYSRRLLRDAPSLHTAEAFRTHTPDPQAETVLTVDGLGQDFDGVTAVDDVSFSVARGHTHAIVGESGSGKTTTGRAVAGFRTPTRGTVDLDGIDVGGLDERGRRKLRKKVQLVYQNPYSSLDPRQRIGSIFAEPLRNYGRDASEKVVAAALERVALDPALAGRLPAELSGGQLQSVAIARALVVEPDVVVFDEAVSALDVSVQAQILRLLDRLQQELDLTYVFISHDLAVVRQISDTVSVMAGGRQVESGRTEEVFTHPQTDYTRELIDAIPGSRYRTGGLNLGL